eukprot:gnl/TRDRNA2_/TRDRNA2_185953_c0_seq1.p1 gnl/TRDRNA2_/TRDRNA2_185953_c0~~gnl/TRDRNA2_/TRDRNA2_185953_c0_seq1.p1  ORF type:complete len:321 (+),score=63.04 gnl/TRDRNA2_/TRDRNA2_185953_c0_seq1:68-1030(+)
MDWSWEASGVGMSSPVAAPFPNVGTQFDGALEYARQCEQDIQTLASRVQKLERSKGQISRDLMILLSEAKEMRQKVDTTGPQAVPAQLSAKQPASPAAPPPMPMVRARTEPAGPTKEHPLSPPPGLMPVHPLSQPESPSIKILPAEGSNATRVEWRIDNVKSKFKDVAGRSLVSPKFEARGADLILMVYPNLGENNSNLTTREQKSQYEAQLANGPLTGAVKLKVVAGCGEKLVIAFKLFVGSVVQELLIHNFAEQSVHGKDFTNNWLDQVENASLVVGVELHNVEQQSAEMLGNEHPEEEWDLLSKEIPRDIHELMEER